MLGKYFPGNKREICSQGDVITNQDECKRAALDIEEDCSEECSIYFQDRTKVTCDCVFLKTHVDQNIHILDDNYTELASSHYSPPGCFWKTTIVYTTDFPWEVIGAWKLTTFNTITNVSEIGEIAHWSKTTIHDLVFPVEQGGICKKG